MNSDTQYFSQDLLQQPKADEIIKKVYEALVVKGYNPTSQMIGYIISGDPTYITSYNNARSIIMKIDRDELLEELLKNYLETVVKK